MSRFTDVSKCGNPFLEDISVIVLSVLYSKALFTSNAYGKITELQTCPLHFIVFYEERVLAFQRTEPGHQTSEKVLFSIRSHHTAFGETAAFRSSAALKKPNDVQMDNETINVHEG